MSQLRRQLYKELVSTAVSEGFQLTEKALQKLETCSDPHQVLYRTIDKMKKISPDSPVIDAQHLVLAVEQPEMQPVHTVVEEPPVYVPSVETINSIDDSYRVEGDFAEFHKLFLHRYHELRKLLSKRRVDFIPVSEIPALKNGEEASVAVMVLSKQEQKNSLRLEVDDPSGQTYVVVSRKNQQLYDLALELLTDVVIGLKIKRLGDLNILTDIILPDVDENSIRISNKIPENYFVLTSDVHVGSKHFRKDSFERFLDWLNRGRDGVVKRISHLIICGDLVEGIGIYPGQEKDLELRNVEDQLKAAAELLAEIPQRIKIVFSPGNHEPVRKALPQPPLQPRYRRILNEKREIIHVSNPAEIVADGRRLTIYHGQGLDEIIQSLPTVSYSNLPEKAVEVVTTLLRYRHLSPIYGGNTQLLPMTSDRLVITETPHLLQTGHIHVLVNTVYRGVRLVNTGAWQEQTDYQKALGLEPNIGYAAIVNISDMKTGIENFNH
ncbi:MAG: metallophosphoesterase [Candidatus Caldarchaeum sp.]